MRQEVLCVLVLDCFQYCLAVDVFPALLKELSSRAAHSQRSLVCFSDKKRKTFIILAVANEMEVYYTFVSLGSGLENE